MAKYGFFLDTSKTQIFACKTTAAGQTDADWDSIDDPVIPNSYAFSQYPITSMWCFKDGDDIHVAHQLENGMLGYSVFDTATDVWTTRDENIALIGDTDFDAAPDFPAVSIAVDGVGVVIVIAAYADATPDQRLRCFRRSGGSWANTGAADGAVAATDYQGVSVAGPDGSNRISWLYKDHTNSDVDTLSISSGGTIDTLATEVDGTVDTADLLLGPGGISGSQVFIPFVDADNTVNIAEWLTGDPPTSVGTVGSVSDEGAVLGNGASAPPFPIMAVAMDGSTPHLIYADATLGDLWHNDDVSGTGGTETKIKDVTLNDISRISVNKMTTDLGYFYDNGNDQVPHFDLVTLAAPAADPLLGLLALMGIGT